MEGCVLEEDNISNNNSNSTLDKTVSSADHDDQNTQAHSPVQSTDADKTQEPKTSDSTSEKEKKTDRKKPAKKKPKGRPPQKKPKTTKQLLISIAIKIATIVIVVWGVFTFVLGIMIHYGNNMHPMVRDGDLVISLRLQKPYINAAVMYQHDGKTTVGRVIAMEGSEINIAENGSFTVNGNAPSEEVFYPTYRADGSDIEYPYTVPQGKVFILNDFREDTNDSRSFGAVDIGDLKGTLLLTMRRRGF